jgi:hypothetical protein
MPIDLAALEPPSPEIQRLLASLTDSQAGMDLFARSMPASRRRRSCPQPLPDRRFL